MTVAELIEKLKEMPQDQPVFHWDSGDFSEGWEEIEGVMFAADIYKAENFDCLLRVGWEVEDDGPKEGS